MGHFGQWLFSFALTQLIEVPILVLWIKQGSLRRRIAIAFGASAITHPILWFVVDPLLREDFYIAYVVVGETFAVITEAIYLRLLGVRQPLLASVSANASSWLVGRGVRSLFF